MGGAGWSGGLGGGTPGMGPGGVREGERERGRERKDGMSKKRRSPVGSSRLARMRAK